MFLHVPLVLQQLPYPQTEHTDFGGTFISMCPPVTTNEEMQTEMQDSTVLEKKERKKG